jgi:hypothetical protein
VTASGKPTYLGMLNAIALGESRAHCYLTEWAAITKEPGVRQVLLTVAAREGEHGMSFAKRINELGFEVRPKPDDGADRALEIVRSDCSDLDKMEALGLQKLDTGTEPDVFDGFFKDHTIDIQTGELLGRYIAEERDSARLLRGCYEQLCAAAGPRQAAAGPRQAAAGSPKAAKEKPDKTAKQLAALDSKVDSLCRSVEELRQIVCAQSMPAEQN